MDDFLRRRAEALGATLVNGLMMGLEKPTTKEGMYVLNYNDYSSGGKVGVPSSSEVDCVIGADGANSRVAKEIDAGDYDYAIAFQERMRISVSPPPSPCGFPVPTSGTAQPSASFLPQPRLTILNGI